MVKTDTAEQTANGNDRK